MKHHGSTFEYEEQRNRELMQAFREKASQCDFISMDDVCCQIVNMPASRFWVSEKRASLVVLAMLKGDRLHAMHENKREMFYEIFRRVKMLMKNYPGESIYNLTTIAVNQRAPRFYLTPGSAKIIIYKIKRKWYEKRKRELKHLF